MKTLQAILSGAVLLVAAVSTLLAQTPVKITADNVNLRAKPKLTAEVVAQANYNDQLEAHEIGEEWVGVSAPDSVDLWISKEFVQMPENIINTRRVNVRAGPSINYNVVTTLSRGDLVEPRGEEVQEWLKIAPPSAARVWISRDYVEIPSDQSAEALAGTPTDTTPSVATEASPPAAIQPAARTRPSGSAWPTPIVSPSVPESEVAVREIPVPPPSDLKLIPLQGQGRMTEVEGKLRAAPLINEAPTRYRVVRWQQNRWQILCHVYGEASKFRSLKGKRVRLKGREYWIQGAAAPVLIPDQVEEISDAGE